MEMEAFVVDNGSQDGSGTAVKTAFPQVHFIQNPANYGFARANNQALRLAKGRYVLLLNPDTQLEDQTIEKLIIFMDHHPSAAVVGGQLLNADGSKQNSIANFPSLATELLNKTLLRWLFPCKFPGKEQRYAEPIEVDSVIGACMMVRRAATDDVGSLDESYFIFLEETDWCFQMKRAGWKIFHHPEAKLYHFQGKSAEGVRGKAKVEYDRSRYHFFKKNRGTLQYFLLWMGVVVRLTLELLVMTIACLITFFRIRNWTQKLSIFAYRMWWHVKLCPNGMGLRPTVP